MEPPLLAPAQTWPLLSMQAMGKAPAAFTKAAGFVGGVNVVLFFGIYLAGDPEAYIEGFMHLAPLNPRPRLQQVLAESGHAPWRWIIGRLIGILITLGLWWMGISAPWRQASSPR